MDYEIKITPNRVGRDIAYDVELYLPCEDESIESPHPAFKNCSTMIRGEFLNFNNGDYCYNTDMIFYNLRILSNSRNPVVLMQNLETEIRNSIQVIWSNYKLNSTPLPQPTTSKITLI